MNYRQSLIRIWQKSKINKKLKSRRFRVVDSISNNTFSLKKQKKIKILEIGCADGKDFLTFLLDRDDLELAGIDIKDYGLRSNNFSMMVGDAEILEFPDKYFDYVVSFGVLEHIQPIEKLARVIKEIDRVAQRYIIMVPSIGSLIEAHTGELLWHLRDRNKKTPYEQLNYFSDEAWLQFEGFAMASTMRFQYIPILKSDLIIFKK